MVYDISIGTQSDSDLAQLTVYIHALASAQDSPWRDQAPNGPIAYKKAPERRIPDSAILRSRRSPQPGAM